MSREITFFSRFEQDILAGRKTITIRDASESHFEPGEVLRVSRNEDGVFFCFIEVLSVTPVRTDALTERHAQQENMSLGELKQVIKEIYPGRMRCLSSSSSNGNPCQNPVVSGDGRPDSANHNGRTHEKTGLAIALLAMMGASTAVWAQDQEQRTAKVGQCAGLQPADVAAQVKRDFLQNRITRWEADKSCWAPQPRSPVSPDAITGKDRVASAADGAGYQDG